MFRLSRVARTFAPKAGRPVARSYSSHASSASGAPIAAGTAAVLLGGLGVYTISEDKKKPSHGTNNAIDTQVPSVLASDVSVSSTVKILDLAAANARIREQAHSFVFDAQEGSGRVDLVRVTSNNPTEDEWDVRVGAGVGGDSKTLFVGVYDGHAGWATSAVLRRALIPRVSNALANLNSLAADQIVNDTIKQVFTEIDNQITENAIAAVKAGAEPVSAEIIAAIAPAISGSCALLSIYDTKTSSIRTAVTGDSRAVLGTWSPEAKAFSAQALSKDQTGFNQDEVNRVAELHPGEKQQILDPNSGRLFGLAITRAFGDHRWKWTNENIKKSQGEFFGYVPKPQNKTPPYVTAEPEVTTRKVTTDDFVILASDGLWDVISNDDAVKCVSRWLAAKKAGKPEPVTPQKSELKVGDEGYPVYKATPEYFAIEDLDNAAVCLVKNALGGNRRGLVTGTLTAYNPISRNVRDDITVQVVFFKDPHSKK